jgi:hypothetical protein
VRAAGPIERLQTLNGVITADRVEKLASAAQRERPIRLLPCRLAQQIRTDGQLVAVRGHVRKYTNLEVALRDDSGGIVVTLAPGYTKDFLYPDLDAVVVGTIQASPLGSTIAPILFVPAVWFQREGEPRRAQRVSDALQARPVGQLVKVRGTVAVTVGKWDELVVFENKKNFVVVRPADQYLSFEPESGTLVDAIGTFTLETIDGREVAVLKEARIDPPDVKVTKPGDVKTDR